MEIVSINLGSYSVKFLRGVVEKRNIQYFDFHEAIIPFSEPQTEGNEKQPFNIENIQFDLIRQYLQDHPSLEKVLLDLPPCYSMIRMMTIPLRNKKKIEQIIPFQLEDELPYPVKDAHIALFPITIQKESYVISLACKTKQFNQFFKKTEQLPLSPSSIIATETIFQSFVLEREITDPIAIIDMGHNKSTCYIFHNKLLLATESSFVAGKLINEIIGETYQLNGDETIAFKHKNAFFLTDEQKEMVDPNQKEFSSLMDRIFANFIDDFKRWDIGYQIKTRQRIQQVYLTGGTSNIKNIKEYLTQKIKVPVYQFECDDQKKLDDLGLANTTKQTLTICHGLSLHLTTKRGLCNFRQKSYAAPKEQSFPLETISFIGVRSMMVCALFLIALVVENAHLSKSSKKLDKKITNQLKNPVFEITPSQRRKMIKDSDKLLDFLKNKNNELQQSKVIFDKVTTTNALKPLAKLSQKISRSHPVELIRFKNENKKILAIFQAQDDNALTSLKQILQYHSYKNAILSVNKEQKKLELTYNE